jgi:hypothetical protein
MDRTRDFLNETIIFQVIHVSEWKVDKISTITTKTMNGAGKGHENHAIFIIQKLITCFNYIGINLLGKVIPITVLPNQALLTIKLFLLIFRRNDLGQHFALTRQGNCRSIMGKFMLPVFNQATPVQSA